MPPRSLAFPLFLLALAALGARGATDSPAPSTPPAESPFLPPPDAAGPRPESPAETYALIGMTVVGQDTLLSITRLSDKRSFWIPVGRTAHGITVVSYDSRADRAVIRADGQTLTLILRKAEAIAHPATAPAPAAPVVVSTGAATPAPPGVVPNRPMTVQEEKEMEARMLVTDLLEIGQQQRKAYEEAQRQAAARAKSAPPPSANAPATPSPSPGKPPAK